MESSNAVGHADPKNWVQGAFFVGMKDYLIKTQDSTYYEWMKVASRFVCWCTFFGVAWHSLHCGVWRHLEQYGVITE